MSLSHVLYDSLLELPLSEQRTKEIVPDQTALLLCLPFSVV